MSQVEQWMKDAGAEAVTSAYSRSADEIADIIARHAPAAAPGQLPSCHVCGTIMEGVCPRCKATTAIVDAAPARLDMRNDYQIALCHVMDRLNPNTNPHPPDCAGCKWAERLATGVAAPASERGAVLEEAAINVPSDLDIGGVYKWLLARAAEERRG